VLPAISRRLAFFADPFLATSSNLPRYCPEPLRASVRAIAKALTRSEGVEDDAGQSVRDRAKADRLRISKLR
jgi:hypothetical protein